MSKAVVLLNMGGPSNLDEVPVFLTNMFADANILTTKSSLLRKLIGSIIVLTRTKSAQSHYKLIGGKSPLLGLTKSLASKIEKMCDAKVYIAMRYTPPFSTQTIEEMKKDGIKELFLLPMYPQYSTTTTKSSFEDFIHHSIKNGFIAKTTHIDRFYKNKEFNNLIIKKIQEAAKDVDTNQYELIFSAHSLPEKIIRSGDSYEKEINEHVDILKEILTERNINFSGIHLAYQSKLGPMKWLGPSLGDTLATITNKRVIIYPIAFTVDNLETVYELDIEYREIAQELGYGDYIVAKCPNDSDEFASVLANMYKEI